MRPHEHRAKRRTEVVGIFPNEAAITDLAGAIPLEPCNEWTTEPPMA